MEMLENMEIMGVRGVRKPKNSPAGDLDANLLFTSVDSLLSIASQKKLYDGDSLDILKLIELRDDLRVEFVSLDPSISGKLSRDGDKLLIKNILVTDNVSLLHMNWRTMFYINRRRRVLPIQSSFGGCQ